MKTFICNFPISPKSGCQSDWSREVSYFNTNFYDVVYLCGQEHLGKGRWVSGHWNRSNKNLMKVYLTEGCCLFYSDSRAVTKWEPELFGFLPLARKVLCALPVQLSPPRMSLLLLSKPYASFNPISNISLFILPMGEFWNLPKVIKHIRGKLREPDSSHPVQYSFFHTSVVQRA